VGNKENEYLFLTPIKQLINVTKEPGYYKKKKKKKRTLKEEILEEITGK
jgi:hypothetical protein